MNFTGERVIPGEVDADLFNEHWARYLFASRYAAGKRVLDAACGSGYGSALLGRGAARVTGIDVAPEAVDYARSHYADTHVTFARADCFSLPFAAGQFNLVVAFEIVEHISDAAGFLKELRRVLAPGGRLLISTPNRLYYTEDRGEVNPYHEKEYSFAEFTALIESAFPDFEIFLEDHVAGLLISEAERRARGTEPIPALDDRHAKDASADSTLGGREKRQREAFYMIAACSCEPLPPMQPLVYLPSTGNVLRERETHIQQLEGQLVEAQRERERHVRELEAQLQEAQQARDEARGHVDRLEALLEERTRWATELNERIAEKDAYLLNLQADYDQKIQWGMSLEKDVDKARAALVQLQREFEERTAWALRLDRDLQFLYGTRWYRIGRKLRMELDPPATAADGTS
jgi:SAM-dependent methyltransferase